MIRLGTFTAGVLTVVALALTPAVASAGEGDGGGTDIIGGAPTSIEQWPWQVAVDSPPDGIKNSWQRQFCGGSLVSQTAVLTAAHCVFDEPGAYAFQQPSEFSIVTGRTDLTTTAGAEIPVSDVIYFVTGPDGRPTPQSVTQPPAGAPLYNPIVSNAWDVAILELNTPAPPPAAPIKIADSSERGLWDAGDPVYATGWGDTDPSAVQNYPYGLYAVDLAITADATCGAQYGTGFDPATMVCAANPGKDTCQGDSGGPLVAAAGDGSFRLVGDTSFGVGCANPSFAGVYGRIADTTMRLSMIKGASIAPGGPGTPVLDTTAPTTKFGKAPKKKSTKRKVKFTFSASEQASFTCKLDKAAAEACTSPYKAKVKYGKHKFSLTATDALENVSAAETYKWKVKKKKRR